MPRETKLNPPPSLGGTVSAPSYTVRYAEADERRRALETEHAIFAEEDFVPVHELYASFDEQSAIMGAFADDGACLGIGRMIEGGVLLPPMLNKDHHVIVTDQRDRWIALAQQGLLTEFATVGVLPQFRISAIFLDLVRYGYRHTRRYNHGPFQHHDQATHMATILEPRTATGLIRKGFCLEQVGPLQHYMAGTPYEESVITAPYVIDWERFEAITEQHQPQFLAWLTARDPIWGQRRAG